MIVLALSGEWLTSQPRFVPDDCYTCCTGWNCFPVTNSTSTSMRVSSLTALRLLSHYLSYCYRRVHEVNPELHLMVEACTEPTLYSALGLPVFIFVSVVSAVLSMYILTSPTVHDTSQELHSHRFQPHRGQTCVPFWSTDLSKCYLCHLISLTAVYANTVLAV